MDFYGELTEVKSEDGLEKALGFNEDLLFEKTFGPMSQDNYQKAFAC